MKRISLNDVTKKLVDLKNTYVSLGITAANNADVEGTNLATIAAILHFGRDDMEARPFLTIAFTKYPDKCEQIIQKEINRFLTDKQDKKTTFGRIGEQIISIIRNEINTNQTPYKLEESTLKARKNRHKKIKNYTPFVLKDSGQLVQALGCEVKDD